MSSVIQAQIVVWSVVLHLYGKMFYLCCCCWHFFFLFFFKYTLSCSSGPFSPQGSLKLHLVTSTPTLTLFPPPRLVFLQTLPEVFLPRGSSFIPLSPLWCKHFVLGAEKAVQTDGERRLLRDLLWHSDADIPKKLFQLLTVFNFSSSLKSLLFV